MPYEYSISYAYLNRTGRRRERSCHVNGPRNQSHRHASRTSVPLAPHNHRPYSLGSSSFAQLPTRYAHTTLRHNYVQLGDWQRACSQKRYTSFVLSALLLLTRQQFLGTAMIGRTNRRTGRLAKLVTRLEREVEGGGWGYRERSKLEPTALFHAAEPRGTYYYTTLTMYCTVNSLFPGFVEKAFCILPSYHMI